MQYRFRQRDGSPIGRGPTGDAFDHARLSPGSRRKCPYRHCRRAPPRAAHQREKYYTTRLHTGSLHYRHQVASAAYTGRSLPTHSTSVPRYTTRGGDYPLTPLPEEPPYLPTFNLDAFVWYTSSCNRTLSFSFFLQFFRFEAKKPGVFPLKPSSPPAGTCKPRPTRLRAGRLATVCAHVLFGHEELSASCLDRVSVRGGVARGGCSRASGLALVQRELALTMFLGAECSVLSRVIATDCLYAALLSRSSARMSLSFPTCRKQKATWETARAGREAALLEKEARRRRRRRRSTNPRRREQGARR